MEDASAPAKAPASFWIVAGLSLVWNSIGAYFYIMARLDPQTVMAGAPQAMQDYVAHMPLWANIAYSLGIWGSFLGSVLLVMRSRHAVAAFQVSLLGAILSFAAQAMAGVLTPAEPVLILTLIAVQWWYARREAGKGTLR